MFKFSIVACARWETQYISEWLQYYDLIGFDHVYLYCNDDDPGEFADQVFGTELSRKDFVSFEHFSGQGQQSRMYLDAIARARRESEWVTFLDIDEFLTLYNCNSISEFMEHNAVNADSVHFNWLNFGNSGFVSRPEGSVLRQYTQRESSLSINTKHLTRSAVLTDERLRGGGLPFWHGLSDPVWSDVRRINVIGADASSLLADHAETTRRYLDDPATRDAIMRKAVISHYALKSEEDFALRAKRGVEGEFSGQAAWKRHHDDGSFRSVLDRMNSVKDTYLLDLSKALCPDVKPSSLSADKPGSEPRRIRVRHQLWTDDLLLGADGRLRHASHGTMGDYYLSGDVLHVRWDTYPPDLFTRQGGVFTHTMAKQNPAIDMRATQAAKLDNEKLSVSSIVLKVPETTALVEIRPASSDVDVFHAIFVECKYRYPVVDYDVKTIFDLGANIGLASVYFAGRYSKSRIIAVEPNKGNFHLLQRNMMALPDAVAVGMAVWSSDAILKLRSVNTLGQALGEWGYQTEAVAADEQGDVAATSIPSLMRRYGVQTIDLLKVDIEGAELEVFGGDTDAWLPFVRCVVIETHERFRAGSDQIVTRKLLPDFDEQGRSGNNRIFIRRSWAHGI